MTYEEKKDYLKSYRTCEREINRLSEEITRAYSQATKVTTTLSLMPFGGQSDRIQSAIDRLCELQEEINKAIDHKVDLRREIIKAVDKLPICQREVLKWKYINGASLEKTAEKMNYSLSQVKRLHRQAIAKL